MSELKHDESKNALHVHGRSQQESKQFTLVWDGVGIMPRPPLIMEAAQGELHSVTSLQLFTTGSNFLIEIEKDLWLDVLPSKEQREEMVKNLCDHCTLRNLLEQCTSHSFSAVKPAARDMLFELLGYGTLLI